MEDSADSHDAIWVHNACAGAFARAYGGNWIMRALGYQAHHIVARTAKGAEATRNYLIKVLGFTTADIDAAFNQVWLKADVHSGIHTSKYYDEVWRRIKPLTSKADVIQELGNIASELMNGTFPYM